MACDISLGRIEPCKDIVGGIDAVYIIPKDQFDPASDITYDATNTDAIESIANTPYAYKFELKGAASNFETAIESSTDNGTTVFTQTLNMTLKKQDIATHKELKLLTWGQFHVIVRDNNNNFFLMGRDYLAEVESGTIVTGGAMTDLSGYTLTIVAREKQPANFFEATTEAALVTSGVVIVDGDGSYTS